MWQGKKKAVTFSFDDGMTYDRRLVELLDKYGLKGTFNLNSSGFGNESKPYDWDGKLTPRRRIAADEVKALYDGHEVAVHTVHHPNLTTLPDDEVLLEVNEDYKALSALVGYDTYGMAYPCGGVNNDERVAALLREHTPIRYARTITSTYNFDLQENLLQFNPTIYYVNVERLFELAKAFLELKTDKPQLFYIWGHSYELEAGKITWEKFEELCRMLSGKDDIFYGTNREVLL